MTRKIPQPPPKADHTRVIERPDGFYWQASDTGEEYGPFATLEEAVADMQAGAPAAGETDFEPSETLEEAEAELGLAEWIDPDTGEPAEESVPRIEDH
jgi:hypothetical protein